MAGWTTLVQAETLAMAIGRADLAIVDCRFSLLDAAAGERAYVGAHIPGAVYAHLERDLSDMGKHGQGRHPWPEAEAFLARLSRWGIRKDSQVIAYDDGDGAYASRLWFLLRTLGHEKVAVLDGGWQRWVSVGLPVSTAPGEPLASRYAVTARTTFRLTKSSKPCVRPVSTCQRSTKRRVKADSPSTSSSADRASPLTRPRHGRIFVA